MTLAIHIADDGNVTLCYSDDGNLEEWWWVLLPHWQGNFYCVDNELLNLS